MLLRQLPEDVVGTRIYRLLQEMIQETQQIYTEATALETAKLRTGPQEDKINDVPSKQTMKSPQLPGGILPPTSWDCKFQCKYLSSKPGICDDLAQHYQTCTEREAPPTSEETKRRRRFQI